MTAAAPSFESSIIETPVSSQLHTEDASVACSCTVDRDEPTHLVSMPNTCRQRLWRSVAAQALAGWPLVARGRNTGALNTLRSIPRHASAMAADSTHGDLPCLQARRRRVWLISRLVPRCKHCCCVTSRQRTSRHSVRVAISGRKTERSAISVWRSVLGQVARLAWLTKPLARRLPPLIGRHGPCL